MLQRRKKKRKIDFQRLAVRCRVIRGFRGNSAQGLGEERRPGRKIILGMKFFLSAGFKKLIPPQYLQFIKL
jgi:hypothetical protein